ncbi:polysaccharide deacetylase family protein [Nitrospinae bacterium AH_259_B05_G02_I21]|nr:polysaccharide deacetylase family protein [Nitrospinae bacterium AH_259_B05_G02_I21]
MIQGQDIICLSTSDWDHPIGSKQQVMRRLAKANRILYVEHQASWLHFLCYPVIQRRRRYFGQVRKLKPGLWTYAPRASLPFGPYLGGINSLNQVRLGAELRRAKERPWREGAKAAISATIGQWTTGRWTKPPLVRILLYHAIGPKGRRATARERVPADHFEAQMAYLAREGYSVVGMEAVVAGLQGDAALPERAVAITFDDGYSSVFHHALPLLKRLGFPATVYVVTDYALEGKVPLGGFLSDEEPLGPDELAALIDEGWTIGSHSATHPRLSSCRPEMAMEEFTESRERLAPVVGRPIDHFSAPHGDWTPELAALLKQAGYRSAATSRMGANRVGDNPLSLRRIEITAWDTAAAFRRKLDGSYDWLGLFRGA